MKLDKKKSFLFLVLIFFVGVFFRCYSLYNSSEFTYDPARDAEIIRQIVQEKKLTLLGPPTSVSVPGVAYGTTYFGPVFYYLLAPFLPLFGYDPYGPILVIALLGAVGIILIFAIVEKITKDPLSALVASFAFAISEGAIFYSRWIWNPNLMPFFILLLIYFLVNFQENKKSVFLFLSGVCLGVIIQLHFIGYWLFLLPVWIICLSCFNERSRKSFLVRFLLLVTGILLAISPMILFEIRHDFLNTRSIIYNLTLDNHPNGDNISFSFKNLGLVATVLLDKFFSLKALWLALPVLVVLFFYSIRVLKNEKYSLFGFYFLVGVLGSSIFNHRGTLDARYVIPLFPVLFILIGLMFYEARKLKRGLNFFLVIIFLVIIIGCSLNHSIQNLGSSPRHSISFFRDISQIIIDDRLSSGDRESFNLAVLVSGLGRRGVSFRYFFNLQNNQILDEVSYPSADTLYVIDDEYGWSGIKNNTDTWEIYSFKPKKLEKVILTSYGVKIYKITK
ncbi:MAG: glycosyltransferase family 39 protein [Candidatus Shapirobacteria bacterium]|nr:glycosyltransferase family 39 protein [Candidatus Shapirobacteria bacterium]